MSNFWMDFTDFDKMNNIKRYYTPNLEISMLCVLSKNCKHIFGVFLKQIVQEI